MRKLIQPKPLLTMLFALGVIVIAGGPSYMLRCAKIRGSIPCRDYQYHEFSPTLRTMSAAELTLDPTPDPEAANYIGGNPKRGTIKYFQFTDRPRLRVDHCSISHMSLAMQKNGKWTLSLRANQNPLNIQPQGDGSEITTFEPIREAQESDGGEYTSFEPYRKFTEHLKRNQFYVKVHCYCGYVKNADNPLLGPPLEILLTPQPFWVQRHVPYTHISHGFCRQISEYFDLVDRVEIEFCYRVDHHQTNGP